MRRLFWFGAGIAAGVALTRKVNETARKATPAGMAEQLGGAMRELANAVGTFGAEVRAGMQERERELQHVIDHSKDGSAQRVVGEPRADSGYRARRAGR
ncbi:hypothetical protein [Saccharopolyspora rectivirgula]|uniref:Secreted protein n=1 Tax=Saccharopolyspora rectivirgula TaxID=28042 RepID=A0A073AYD4_9PSEU|nr:hypothetical protein [Saccharopolyspora rectivirgula]KEI44773.1 hypothetical protein GU90_08310 [Saccharopolyspora rectivirgula]